MIALYVRDVKTFMAQLLAGSVFDEFLISEGSVTTFCTYTLDGTWQRDFFDPAHEDETMERSYTPWANVKEFFFSVIKGKHTPLTFKFVFQLSPAKIPSFLAKNEIPAQPQDIYGLYMNYRYDGSALMLTTGSSQKTFTRDKTLDSAWDLFVMSFLKENGIATEQVQ